MIEDVKKLYVLMNDLNQFVKKHTLFLYVEKRVSNGAEQICCTKSLSEDQWSAIKQYRKKYKLILKAIKSIHNKNESIKIDGEKFIIDGQKQKKGIRDLMTAEDLLRFALYRFEHTKWATIDKGYRIFMKVVPYIFINGSDKLLTLVFYGEPEVSDDDVGFQKLCQLVHPSLLLGMMHSEGKYQFSGKDLLPLMYTCATPLIVFYTLFDLVKQESQAHSILTANEFIDFFMKKNLHCIVIMLIAYKLSDNPLQFSFTETKMDLDHQLKYVGDYFNTSPTTFCNLETMLTRLGSFGHHLFPKLLFSSLDMVACQKFIKAMPRADFQSMIFHFFSYAQNTKSGKNEVDSLGAIDLVLYAIMCRLNKETGWYPRQEFTGYLAVHLFESLQLILKKHNIKDIKKITIRDSSYGSMGGSRKSTNSKGIIDNQFMIISALKKICSKKKQMSGWEKKKRSFKFIGEYDSNYKGRQEYYSKTMTHLVLLFFKQRDLKNLFKEIVSIREAREIFLFVLQEIEGEGQLKVVIKEVIGQLDNDNFNGFFQLMVGENNKVVFKSASGSDYNGELLKNKEHVKNMLTTFFSVFLYEIGIGNTRYQEEEYQKKFLIFFKHYDVFLDDSSVNKKADNPELLLLKKSEESERKRFIEYLKLISNKHQAGKLDACVETWVHFHRELLQSGGSIITKIEDFNIFMNNMVSSPHQDSFNIDALHEHASLHKEVVNRVDLKVLYQWCEENSGESRFASGSTVVDSFHFFASLFFSATCVSRRLDELNFAELYCRNLKLYLVGKEENNMLVQKNGIQNNYEHILQALGSAVALCAGQETKSRHLEHLFVSLSTPRLVNDGFDGLLNNASNDISAIVVVLQKLWNDNLLEKNLLDMNLDVFSKLLTKLYSNVNDNLYGQRIGSLLDNVILFLIRKIASLKNPTDDVKKVSQDELFNINLEDADLKKKISLLLVKVNIDSMARLLSPISSDQRLFVIAYMVHAYFNELPSAEFMLGPVDNHGSAVELPVIHSNNHSSAVVESERKSSSRISLKADYSAHSGQFFSGGSDKLDIPTATLLAPVFSDEQDLSRLQFNLNKIISIIESELMSSSNESTERHDNNVDEKLKNYQNFDDFYNGVKETNLSSDNRNHGQSLSVLLQWLRRFSEETDQRLSAFSQSNNGQGTCMIA